MRKKYGLALGSGGAKGIVHIGALQALEEEKISFDLVAGTSIGSIVGGMYALGYTAREMISVIEEMQINKSRWLLNLKFKNLSLENRLKEILGERTFSELKIPFCAVASNLDTGEEVNIKSGDLCLAMSASSAIPPAFKPVIIDDKRLVDGAFVNSIPADVCKKMGAHYILAIDLSADKPMNFSALKLLNTLYKNNKIKKSSRSYNGYKYADIILAPDLTKYNMLGVGKSKELFDIGYTIIKNNLSIIKEKLNLS